MPLLPSATLPSAPSPWNTSTPSLEPAMSSCRSLLVVLLLLWLLEVLLPHLPELPLGPQRVTFISHNPTTMAQGILAEEIRRKLKAPVSDLLYMLLTCNAKFVENFDVLLNMLLECC